jgi:ElaB/YqjD/DUF883 family membrane-anchored ribosome-binding protein
MEIWISEKGDGKVLTVARDSTPKVEVLPDPLAEDLQEIQDAAKKLTAERKDLMDRLRDVLERKSNLSGDELARLQKQHIEALDEAIERAEELIDLAVDSDSPLVPDMRKSLAEMYRLKQSIYNDTMTVLRTYKRKTGP